MECIEGERRFSRGLCSRHYQHYYWRGTLEANALPPLDGGYEHPRATGAATNSPPTEPTAARGDRPLLAGSFGMPEAAAYLLGFFDALSTAKPAEAIDPYIVRRFHELRGEHR